MIKIAALYTCYNRKEKTLLALQHLMQSYQESSNDKFYLDIYLTDDGSTDGTAAAVSISYPEVEILKGTGALFWSEGMRMAWNKALEKNYDFFLLLNDDTLVHKNLFIELFKAHQFCRENYMQAGIYLGATQDEETKKLTYSGSLITNTLLYTQKRLAPNNTYQQCDIGNANIMLVPKEVVGKLGILTKGYAHGKGDYDYTLRASRKNIPVLLAPIFLGYCPNDHKNPYSDFQKKTRKQRKASVYSETQLDFKSHYKFVKLFFPWRAPFVWFFSKLKIYFPKVYLGLVKKRDAFI